MCLKETSLAKNDREVLNNISRHPRVLSSRTFLVVTANVNQARFPIRALGDDGKGKASNTIVIIETLLIDDLLSYYI